MSGSVKVELISSGIVKLMNAPGMDAACALAAQRVASKAGEHFKVKGPLHPGSRALSLVVPADSRGAYLEATEKTLSKAVSSCRL